MSDKRKSPKAYAITLSKAWGDRFPVDVKQIALEISSKQKDPIAKIEPLPVSLDEFEGALLRKAGGKRWGVAYSSHIREPGKINFTIAHEFGHYELHRESNGAVMCSEEDLRDFARASDGAHNIEQEANEFASYLLMPIGDFRKQVDGQPINLELLAYCADRYATSLTACAIKLIEFVNRPIVAVVSKGGVVKWSRSSEAALNVGCWLKRGTPVPTASLTMRCHEIGVSQNDMFGALTGPKVWFESAAVWESAIGQPHYGAVFTLLECRGVSRRIRDVEGEDEAPDAYDHFTSFSR